MSGEQSRVIDPVCQMSLDVGNAAEAAEYQGCRYFFCSIGCRAEFERHPDDYAVKNDGRDERNDV